MYNQIAENKRKSWFLIIIFVLFALGIGFLFGEYSGDRYAGLVIAALISLVMTSVSYFQGDKLALSSSHAKLITSTDNPYLYRMVENLCITSGMTIPKIHIIEDSAINAFACGRDPQHASIAVTTGALSKLENEELEGVLAHELSHIQNYDIRVMTIVIVLVGLIALLSDWLLRAQLFGGRRDRENGGNILMIVGIILAILSPIIAELIKLAVSRKREYLADASGALLTRYPEGLALALEKIGSQQQPLLHANNATAHLFFSNPFGTEKKSFSNLFSTHPPLVDRIKKLREMA